MSSHATPALLAPAHDAVRQLVHGFYAELRRDPLLGPVFAPLLDGHWDAHLERMVNFWCTALKIERRFRGDVYQRHMVLPNIRPEHLLRWLQLWNTHCQHSLPPALAQRAQTVALGVGRVMHLGWFGQLPTHQQLACQVEHLTAAQAPA